jgi:hypothetical protein
MRRKEFFIKMEFKEEKRVLESLDHNVFQRIGDDIFFQFTHHKCQTERIDHFTESNLYRVKTKVPIYRLFQPSPLHEDTYLHATSFYFVPYEDGYQTISWKGYHSPHLANLQQYKEPYELQREMYAFLLQETPMDALIEHSFQQNYQFTYYDKENEKEMCDQHQIFYTQNVNVGNTTVIDDVYMEYIIMKLSEKNPKREYVRICTEERMESYVKNLEDYQMMNELLGEYGWNPKRRYLFKVADIDYETAILIK